MEALISIIVPVYNTEPYLKKCVDSLLAQTYKNIEIILIDDCSTDKSRSLCYELQKQNNNILVVCHDENCGLEATRNSGLENAKGDWIMFLDSDDTFENNAAEDMVNFAISNNCDVVLAPYKIFQNGVEKKMEAKISTGSYTSKEFASHFLTDIEWGVISCIGSKIYKKSFIDEYHLRFDRQYKYNEDAAFIYTALYNCNTVGYADIPFYNYIIRTEGSIQSSYRINLYSNLQKTKELLRKYLKSNDAFKGKIYNEYIKGEDDLISVALINEARYKGYTSFKREFEIIKNGESFNEIVDKQNILTKNRRIILIMLKNNCRLVAFIFFKLFIRRIK